MGKIEKQATGRCEVSKTTAHLPVGRQVGQYIVDFVSFEGKLIVEIDGGQHNEGEMRERDEERTKWLEERGYRVLRFWNNEVLMNMKGVLERISEALK